ncbi:30S ribosomal protein S27ae [Candidatus Bathyarchaeota archaeon]|nr:MAG: 30S ribosomal protein S27ae [Candidatus Bathyarchaeota archaeon]
MSQPPPKKEQVKPAPTKSKRKSNRQRNELYEVSPSGVKMKNKKCPRCGAVMAYHKQPKERWVCGSCSFTDYPTKA